MGSSTALGSAATSYDSSFAGRLQAFYRKNTATGNSDTIVTAVGGYGYTTYKFLPNGYVPPVIRHSVDGNVNVNAVLAMNPDIVIINLPGNDVSAYAQPWISPVYSTKETMDNFRVMYNFFVSNNVKCFVTTTQPRNDLDVSQRQLQRNLVDSITNNFGTFSINFWDDLVVPGGSNLLKDEVRNVGYADQDYHLNNTGHRYLFERVKNKDIFQTSTPPPPPSSYTNVPSKIEAENYTAMSGVQTEPCGDAGGGSNVGYIDQGDWMNYNINATSAGSYNVALRVAAFNLGGQLQIRKADGTLLATVATPQTGGWQTWQTLNTTINLTSGNQTLRVISTASANWNINWMNFTFIQPPPPPPPPSNYVSIPARIEAESYVAQSGTQTEPTSDAGAGQNVGYIDNGDWMDYNISTSAGGNFIFRARVASPMSGGQLQLRNSSGTVLATLSIPNTGSWQTWTALETPVTLPSGNQTLRVISTSASNWNVNWIEFIQGATPPPASSTRIEAENYTAMSGVLTETTSDAGGGLNVTNIDQWDWMDYSYTAPSAGAYQISFRLATPVAGGQLALLKTDGTLIGAITIFPTGGWQTWQTVTGTFTLPAGPQTLRLASTASGKWNVNWIEIKAPAPLPAPPGYYALPGKIEAENYSSMNGVQNEVTTDIGGGQNVGYIAMGDWMEYEVSSASQTSFTLKLRVASEENGGQLQIRKPDGTVLASFNIPNTGGWQNWQTITGIITLPQGNQTIRIISTATAGWNMNWLEFVQNTASLPVRIEAENYTAMSGVQIEITSDAGGGLNVTGIDRFDWMEYPYTATSAGYHDISFRIAALNSGGELVLLKADGTSLGAMTVHPTGGWQTWRTYTGSFNLPAGTQTLRLVSTGSDRWNINWIEIKPVSSPPQASNKTVQVQTELLKHQNTTTSPAIVFPNPVRDQLVIKMNHPYLGALKAEIFDISGKTVKVFSLKKFSQITTHTVSMASLSRGYYIVKLSINDWSSSITIQKE